MATIAMMDTTNQVINIFTADTPPPDQPDTWCVVIDGISPAPGLGWTSADHGLTFSPPGPTSVLGNTQLLLSKAAAALNNNQTYLGLASPTTAQAVAQVASLTRQVNALIRLATGQLTATTGT
mgnify:FL=1